MIYAIVPVKTLTLAKGRLSGVLSAKERATLALSMLEDVLQTLMATATVHAVGVISPDPVVRALAAKLGAEPLIEQTNELNRALTAAAIHATHAGANTIVVLHADLPLVTPGEIELLLDAVQNGTDIALAPARDGGTNAIAFRTTADMPFLFGSASLTRHLAVIRERGLTARLVRTTGLEHDIDRPDDLLWLADRAGDRITQRLVRKIALTERLACT